MTHPEPEDPPPGHRQPAVGTEELRDLADMLRTELVVIDSDTTIPGIQNELRWSSAYHRLAARL